MTSVNLELEDELLNLLGQAGKPAEQTAREMIVLELYRRQAISDRRASELLGMSQQEFAQYVSSLGIAYDGGEPMQNRLQQPSSKLEALKKQRFTPEGKAERVARSLAALHQEAPIKLPPGEWVRIVEDPDMEDQFL